MYPTKFVRCPLRRDGGKGAPSLSIQVHLVTQTCFVAVATVDSTLLELFSLTTAGPSAWVLDERRWWITEVPLDHCAPGSEGYQVCSCLALRMSCWASPHLAGRWRHKVVIDNLRCIHMAHRGRRWGMGVVPPLGFKCREMGRVHLRLVFGYGAPILNAQIENQPLLTFTWSLGTFAQTTFHLQPKYSSTAI